MNLLRKAHELYKAKRVIIQKPTVPKNRSKEQIPVSPSSGEYESSLTPTVKTKVKAYDPELVWQKISEPVVHEDVGPATPHKGENLLSEIKEETWVPGASLQSKGTGLGPNTPDPTQVTSRTEPSNDRYLTLGGAAIYFDDEGKPIGTSTSERNTKATRYSRRQIKDRRNRRGPGSSQTSLLVEAGARQSPYKHPFEGVSLPDLMQEVDRFQRAPTKTSAGTTSLLDMWNRVKNNPDPKTVPTKNRLISQFNEIYGEAMNRMIGNVHPKSFFHLSDSLAPLGPEQVEQLIDSSINTDIPMGKAFANFAKTYLKTHSDFKEDRHPLRFDPESNIELSLPAKNVEVVNPRDGTKIIRPQASKKILVNERQEHEQHIPVSSKMPLEEAKLHLSSGDSSLLDIIDRLHGHQIGAKSKHTREAKDYLRYKAITNAHNDGLAGFAAIVRREALRGNHEWINKAKAGIENGDLMNHIQHYLDASKTIPEEKKDTARNFYFTYLSNLMTKPEDYAEKAANLHMHPNTRKKTQEILTAFDGYSTDKIVDQLAGTLSKDPSYGKNPEESLNYVTKLIENNARFGSGKTKKWLINQLMNRLGGNELDPSPFTPAGNPRDNKVRERTKQLNQFRSTAHDNLMKLTNYFRKENEGISDDEVKRHVFSVFHKIRPQEMSRDDTYKLLDQVEDYIKAGTHIYPLDRRNVTSYPQVSDTKPVKPKAKRGDIFSAVKTLNQLHRLGAYDKAPETTPTEIAPAEPEVVGQRTGSTGMTSAIPRDVSLGDSPVDVNQEKNLRTIKVLKRKLRKIPKEARAAAAKHIRTAGTYGTTPETTGPVASVGGEAPPTKVAPTTSAEPPKQSVKERVLEQISQGRGSRPKTDVPEGGFATMRQAEIPTATENVEEKSKANQRVIEGLKGFERFLKEKGGQETSTEQPKKLVVSDSSGNMYEVLKDEKGNYVNRDGKKIHITDEFLNKYGKMQ